MRSMIAEIFNKALPMPPVSGPPLPEFFRIRWPAGVSYKIPSQVQVVDSTYLGLRRKVSSMIRGY